MLIYFVVINYLLLSLIREEYFKHGYAATNIFYGDSNDNRLLYIIMT